MANDAYGGNVSLPSFSFTGSQAENLARGWDYATSRGEGYVWTGGAVAAPDAQRRGEPPSLVTPPRLDDVDTDALSDAFESIGEGIEDLVCTDTSTQDDEPDCANVVIPQSCVQDFVRYSDTSGECFQCATSIAPKIASANPGSVVTIMELETTANPPGAPRRFGWLLNRDQEVVGTTGLHEVVVIDSKCYMDALVYKYFGLRAVSWQEYMTVWAYEDFVRPTGNSRLPGSKR
jgi:hypothetical protein